MPTTRRHRNDATDADAEGATEESATEDQSTLVLTAADAAAMYEFAGDDTAKFRKLFAFIAELYGRQSAQPHSSAAAPPKQPVIA
ncbi:MAG: hypothetical protein ABWY12_09660 [Burkholderiales bacterium]